MALTYLLLGSNQGDREYLLAAGINRIAMLPGQVLIKSGIYVTAAWGLADQPDFLNQVILFRTSLLPEDLLAHLNQIEQELGRIRKIKWSARVIDIDILYYDDLILQTDNLTIPHPHLHERRFTLVPLKEIAPEYRHPLLEKTSKELLATCPDNLEVKAFSPAS